MLAHAIAEADGASAAECDLLYIFNKMNEKLKELYIS
jgi:hypothetical protein